MARVTVEDCVDKIPNRFDLVLLAAERARAISGGAELTVDRDRDKNPVVALREIAESTVRPAVLKENLIQSMQRVLPDDDDQVDEIGSLSASAEALQAALVDSHQAAAWRMRLAEREGALVPLILCSEDGAIPLWRLLAERALCVNTTAAGGNASLMTISV